MNLRTPIVGLRAGLMVVALVAAVPGLIAILRTHDAVVLLSVILSIGAVAAAAEIFVLRPARIMKGAARLLARGNFSARIDLERLTGMDDFGRAMNDLVDALAMRRLQQDAVERTLRKSEDRYRTLFDENPYPMWVYHRETLAFLEVNESAIERYGYTRDEFLSMTILDVRPAADELPVRDALASTDEDWVAAGPSRHQTKTGRIVDVEVNSHAFRFDGKPAVLAAVRDVSDRMRAEAELRKAQERMRFALEASRVGVWEATVEPNEAHWSTTLEAMHGLAPGSFGGSLTAFLDTVHPDDRDRVLREHRAAIHGEPEMRIQYRTLWPSGTVRLLRANGQVFRDAHGKATRVAGVVMDVTDQQALEDTLRRSQRMEAVGQLAGGVAHDFNNLLMVIEGNIGIAIRALDKSSPIRGDLQQVRQAAGRAAKLTAQLLAFSRKQSLSTETVDVDQLVGALVPMVRRLIGEDIDVTCELEAGGAMTITDPVQLEQSIVNLALNARDAMSRGGRLMIATSVAELTRSDILAQRMELEPGEFVSILVKDTGSGMDDATLARAFEPFFTTKEVGRGTGLGLSSVYGTVKQSGGHVSMRSAPGLGTAVAIYLPRALHAGAVEHEITPAHGAPRAVAGKTILLVEDERGVRELIARLLLANGYHVIAVDTGAEAIERAERHEGAIDLVLSDVVLPGVPVTSMIQVLRTRRSTMPVLLMSGYPDAEISRRGLRTEEFTILQKPIPPDTLLAQVANALQPPPREGPSVEHIGAVA